MGKIIFLLSIGVGSSAMAAKPYLVICSNHATVFQAHFELDVLSVKDSFGQPLWSDGIKSVDYTPDGKSTQTEINVHFDETGKLNGQVVEQVLGTKKKPYKKILNGKYVGEMSHGQEYKFDACELYYK